MENVDGQESGMSTARVKELATAGLDPERKALPTFADKQTCFGEELARDLKDSRIGIVTMDALKGVALDNGVRIKSYEFMELIDPVAVREGKIEYYAFSHENKIFFGVKKDINADTTITMLLPAQDSVTGERLSTKQLIVEDKRSGKTINLVDLLPSEWDWKYHGNNGRFSQDSEAKTLYFGSIFNPDGLIKLFHEYGHCVNDGLADKEMSQELMELWKKYKAGVWNVRERIAEGGNKIPREEVERMYAEVLTTEEKQKIGPMLSKEERGASAIARGLERVLEGSGFNLGIGFDRSHRILFDAGLEDYRSVFGGGIGFKFEQTP